MPPSLTHDLVKQRIASMENGEYELTSQFTLVTEPITVKHKCGNLITVKAKGFMQEGAGRCKICYPVTAKRGKVMNEESFTERFNSELGSDYEIAGRFEAYKKPISIRHKTCNHVWSVTPHMLFTKNRGCPECANLRRGSHLREDDYLGRILSSQLHGTEYRWLTNDYDNDNKKKLPIVHDVCSTQYEVRPNDFQQGYRCPVCYPPIIKESTGSLMIKRILTELQIPFQCETSHPDLKVGIRHYLRFDFDIDLGNDEHLIIEYDGVQHSQLLKVFTHAGVDPSVAFERRQMFDKMKDDFCANHPSYNIHRIKHSDHTEKKLMEILNLYFEFTS